MEEHTPCRRFRARAPREACADPPHTHAPSLPLAMPPGGTSRRGALPGTWCLQIVWISETYPRSNALCRTAVSRSATLRVCHPPVSLAREAESSSH